MKLNYRFEPDLIETARITSRELGTDMKSYVSEAIRKKNEEYESRNMKLENRIHKILENYEGGEILEITNLEVAERLNKEGFKALEVRSPNLEEGKPKTWVMKKG